MSDISEECWCAGWMMGNEYALWRMVSDPTESHRYGQDEVTNTQIADLRAISSEIGGWIVWDDAVGEKFLPMDEWLAMYTKG